MTVSHVNWERLCNEAVIDGLINALPAQLREHLDLGLAHAVRKSEILDVVGSKVGKDGLAYLAIEAYLERKGAQ